MIKRVAMALVACFITVSVASAEPRANRVSEKVVTAAVTAKKVQAKKPAAPTSTRTASSDYQLERDGCCFGTTMAPWY
jgi:hypothetical protein